MGEVVRINGIKANLARYSDDELEANMGFAHERIENGVRDLEALGIESARRFALGDMALQDTVEFPAIEDPAQGKLFYFPVRPEPFPPAA
jgi:hypothetical protein